MALSEAEQHWRDEAIAAMQHAAEVLESYQHLVPTMAREAERFCAERILTERLRNYWHGAGATLRQVERHLPANHAEAAPKLRRLVQAPT